MKLAKRTAALRPSAAFELLKRAKALRRQRRDVISLAIGELPWPAYMPVRKAAKKAIDEGHGKYTPSAGRPELRIRLARELEKSFGFPLEPENVAVSAGVKFALFAVFQTLCDPGDEVIVPAPFWMSYPDIISLSGASPRTAPAKESAGFKLDPEGLEEAITSRSRALLLNSPNNPTGAVYTESEMKALGKALSRFPDIAVVTDDIYDRLSFSSGRAPHFLAACPELRDRVLALGGASKNYLMTGWRAGWLAGPKDFVKVFSAFQSQSISCANEIAQKALEDSLPLCEGEIRALREKLRGKRDFFLEGIGKIPGIRPFPPEGAFYLWAGVQDLLGRRHQGEIISSSRDLMERLLLKKSLLCLCGEEFGAPGFLRFSFGLERETLEKALARLSEFVSEMT